MNRIILSHSVNPVIPLAGIPIRNYTNTYMATRLDHKCLLRASYRLTKCRDDTKSFVKESNNNILMYINSYLNIIFTELIGSCVDGTLSIECDLELPDIVLFVIGTTEVLFNILRPRRTEYDDYLQALAVLDNKFWFTEPTYITSLRCAYIYQGACVCRNVDEVVKLEALDADIKYIASVGCSSDICLELQSPFDNPSTLYILKLTSHVISRVAQDVLGTGFVSESTASHLNLLYSTETSIVLEALKQSLAINSLTPLKPVTDVTSIRFYMVTLKRGKEQSADQWKP